MTASSASARTKRLLLLGGAFLALLIVDFWLLTAALADKPSGETKQWCAHVLSLTAILVVSIAVALVHRKAVRRQVGEDVKVPGILIGDDNRLSTSKLAAFTWTWVLAWAILSLAIAFWLDADAGWTAFRKASLQDEYLILLGGPFVALVSAKALVGAAVEDQTQVKTKEEGEPTIGGRISEAFSDDSGQTDLVDTQYLVFGAVTLLVFAGMFLDAPDKGLPDLPDVLVGVASVGATAYIANKFTARDAPPHIDRVVPERAGPGQDVMVFGRNLLSVSKGGKRSPADEPLRVFFGTLATTTIDPKDPAAHTTASGNDYFTVQVPTATGQTGDNAAPVSVQNAAGVLSDNTADFTLVLP